MLPSTPTNTEQDPGIVDYITHEMIFAKYGEGINSQKLKDEIYRVYPQIVDGIFDQIFKTLPKDKQSELEEKILNGADFITIQEFLTQNITDLPSRTTNFMIYMAESYLNGEI